MAQTYKLRRYGGAEITVIGGDLDKIETNTLKAGGRINTYITSRSCGCYRPFLFLKLHSQRLHHAVAESTPLSQSITMALFEMPYALLTVLVER